MIGDNLAVPVSNLIPKFIVSAHALKPINKQGGVGQLFSKGGKNVVPTTSQERLLIKVLQQP